MTFRGLFLRTLVLLGVALLLITEALGAFSLIRPIPLMLCWTGMLAAIIYWVFKLRRTLDRTQIALRRDPIVIFSFLSIATILVLTAWVAAFSPPNSADATAYHMPRVIYWAEQASVRFFPTPYLNQIMLQPLAEYLMLHTYVLTGGDRLVNFGQWFASLASIIGVSAIARMFGADTRGQAIAALFCATIPGGILASSGAKNDYVLAMWLVAAVYFAMRFMDKYETADALFMGAALGLACLTKATAYLFAPWILAAVIAARFDWRQAPRVPRGMLYAGVCALALNAPHYLRNYGLSGSVMGFDSAQADGFFRWRNETFGWKQTVSNLLRNTSEQLGARSNRWNQEVYSVVLNAHRRLAIDPNDPATTFRWSAYGAPKNANHEADAPNRWHLTLLLLATSIVVFRLLRNGARGRDRERAWYALALLCAFVAFCAYLKWQPFASRLFLPLFVLGAPLASVFAELFRATWRRTRLLAQTALCLLLLDNARLPLLENWVRPLRGPRSVLKVSRSDQYFADIGYWNNAESYRKTAELLARTPCDTIGVDITNLQLEYPLQALVREQKPKAQFIHTGVENVSRRYADPVEKQACAVVCLDCAADARRMSLYSSYPNREAVGKFVIFGKDSPTGEIR